MIETPEPDESQPNKELSPGKILLQGRLQAGLTQEQVAKELYMTVYKVKALEADDYSRLSSDTFARGYIRAYANLVKVDVVLVLVAYDVFINNQKPRESTQKHAVVAENNHRGAWQFLAVIGAFFIGLWLISVWFFDNHSDTPYVVADVNVSSIASQKVKPSLAHSAVSEMNNVNGVASSMSALVAENMKSGVMLSGSSSSVQSASKLTSQMAIRSSVAAINAVTVVEQAARSAKKTSLDEISFSFRAESWLEVSDSRGDVLATELEPAGSKVKFVGLAPFDVKLGNAPAVDIQLNGKKIDVIPLMGSNVLILKVGN